MCFIMMIVFDESKTSLSKIEINYDRQSLHFTSLTINQVIK